MPKRSPEITWKPQDIPSLKQISQGGSVKLILSCAHQPPPGALASIDWKKQRKMWRVANAWLQKNATSRDAARIDVITLEPQHKVDALAIDSYARTAIWRGHRLLWLQNAVESAT